MKITRQTMVLLLMTSLLMACTSSPKELHSPCPDFGRGCKKAPVNAWEVEK